MNTLPLQGSESFKIYFSLYCKIARDKIANSSIITYLKKEITQEIRYKLKVFEITYHVLWGEWSGFMFDQYKDKVYYDIAKLKYKRLIQAFALD